MPTDLDVITTAFRLIGMGVSGQIAGDEIAAAREIFASQSAELGTENPVPWDSESIPQEAVVPLAMFLKSDLAPVFGMDGGSRGRAKLRCLALVRPDTRQPALDVDAEYY